MLISQPGQALKEDRREESRRIRRCENTHYSWRRFRARGTVSVCVCVYNLPCLLPLLLAAFPPAQFCHSPCRYSTDGISSFPSLLPGSPPPPPPPVCCELLLLLPSLSSSLLCVCVCVYLVSSAFSCCLLACLLAVDFCSNKFLF